MLEIFIKNVTKASLEVIVSEKFITCKDIMPVIACD